MTSALELSANAVSTVAIFLAGRNSIHTWWTGMVGCTLFAVLFYQSQLYADVSLQAFFVLSSVIGWRRWLHGDAGRPLSVAPADFRSLAWTLPVGLAATAAYGALLHYWTDAYMPFIDSAILVFSVIGQLLLMGRRIETWPFWVAVNTVAVPLYASRGLTLTACLYAVYWVNAVVSWMWWRRLAARQGGALAYT